MKGYIFRRCGCRDESGRQLGNNCPKLSKRGHGAWGYRHDLPRSADGRRRQVKGTGYATRADAERALTAALGQVDSGTFVETDRGLTVGRYLSEWLDGRGGIAESTRDSYRGHITRYLDPGLGHLKLTDLREAHVAQLYAAMRQIGRTLPPGQRLTPVLRRLLDARLDDEASRRPMSAANVRRVHATLTAALNSAVKRGRLPRNPAAFVELDSGRPPRAVVWTPDRVSEWQRTGKRYPVAVWTPEQVGAFLDYAEADGLQALWHLIAYRGLRRAEACALHWADVDLDAAALTVRVSKTDAGRRAVSLDAGTVAVLRAHRKRQASARLAAGEAWQDSGRVFVKGDGSPLVPNSVSQRFDRLVARSGLPPIRLHDLRHVAATLALAAGVPLKAVSEQLGHASLQLTADTYASVLPQVQQAAAEAVRALVPRATPTAH